MGPLWRLMRLRWCRLRLRWCQLRSCFMLAFMLTQLPCAASNGPNPSDYFDGFNPPCPVGYRDSTNGNSYFWACEGTPNSGHDCPGGAYTTANCKCACVTDPDYIAPIPTAHPTATPEPTEPPLPVPSPTASLAQGTGENGAGEEKDGMSTLEMILIGIAVVLLVVICILVPTVMYLERRKRNGRFSAYGVDERGTATAHSAHDLRDDISDRSEGSSRSHRSNRSKGSNRPDGVGNPSISKLNMPGAQASPRIQSTPVVAMQASPRPVGASPRHSPRSNIAQGQQCEQVKPPHGAPLHGASTAFLNLPQGASPALNVQRKGARSATEGAPQSASSASLNLPEGASQARGAAKKAWASPLPSPREQHQHSPRPQLQKGHTTQQQLNPCPPLQKSHTTQQQPQRSPRASPRHMTHG